MADETPKTPGSGDAPPKPAESSKVQPKKETVRINLPPKPKASSTIKIPVPAAGATKAPAAAPAAATPAAAAAPAASAASAPKVAAAPASAPASPGAAPAAAPAPRPLPARRGGASVSGLDIALAVGALVASLVALVRIALIS